MYNYGFQMPQSNMDWIMVQNVAGVDSVTVAPNQKAWIMIQSEPMFAVKTADNFGRTTCEFYKFEKVDPVKQSDYVTMEQLQKMLSEIKENTNESTTKRTTKATTEQ